MNLSKLLQPGIMTVLADGGLHGYAIVDRLTEIPTLGGTRPDPTGVYRMLSSMEEGGFVTSSWDASERGPAKKIYELSPAGRKCLARWISSLSDYHRAIGELLARARKAAVRRKPAHRRGEK
jgi:DNA-binding PadR family transcriptional regulator